MKKSLCKTSVWNLIEKCSIIFLAIAIIFPAIMPANVSYALRAGSDTASIPSFTVVYNNVDAGVLVDLGIKRDGKQAIKMYNRTPYANGNDFMLQQLIRVEQGKKYEYGLSIKGENVSSAYMIFANWKVNTNILPFGNTFDWIDLKFDYEHTTESITYPFIIRLWDVTNAFWIDNMYFYEVDENGNRVGENLFKNGSFESTGKDAKKAFGSGSTENIIILKPAPADLKIDGNLDEWKDTPSYKFEAPKMQYLLQPHNAEAEVQYFFDENYFYFAVTAYDQIHHAPIMDTYWETDSVQYVVSKIDENFGRELGVVYDDKTDESATFGFDGIVFKGSREEGKTFYEVAVPWSVRGWSAVPERFLFGAIVNNNDSMGRIGTVEYTPGISGGKINNLFPQLIPLEPKVGFMASIEAVDTPQAGVESEFSVMVLNGYDEAKDITINIPEFNYSETFHLEANGVYNEVFKQTIEKSGKLEVTVNASCDGIKKTINSDFTVLPNNVVVQKYCDDLEEKCNLLEKKIYECSKEGHYVDYERTNLNVIKKFKSYMEEDVIYDEYNYAANTYNELVDIYNESIKNLDSYLSGEKKSFYVPERVSVDYTMENGGFRADVIKEDGTISKDPVFYCGFLDFGNRAISAQEDKELGLSMEYIDIAPGWGCTEDSKILCYKASNDDFCEIVEDEKAGGEYALKISVPKNESFTLSNHAELEPLNDYEVRFKVKGENVESATFDFGGGTSSKTFSGTFDWTEYSFSATAGRTEQGRNFYIKCQSADNLWIDDISIIKKGGGWECANNGGFEMGYGNQSERGYVFIDTYAERVNYQINEMYEKDVPFFLNLVWFMGVTTSSCKEKDPLFNNQYNHPLYIEPIKYFITELMKRVDQDKLFTVSLANEPNHRAADEWYRPLWIEWLKDVYNNDLSELNRSYSTEYESFDAVPFPNTAGDSTNIFNDWMHFNNKMFVDCFAEIVGAFKEVAPNVNCQIKIMQHVFKVDRRVNYGNNYELMSDLFEISGCDTFSYKDSASHAISSRLKWLDYLTSNKNVPVFDTEMHVFLDGAVVNYNEEHVKYTLSDLWQSSIHKLGATSIWLMDRDIETYRGSKMYNATNFALMPKYFAAILKQNKDLSRLSNEVTALQNRDVDVAILYSWNPVQKNVSYVADLHTVYDNLLNEGEKVFIINEERPELLNESGIKVLFLPGATHVKSTTAENIKTFIEQGGMVVMTENDLKYDPHDNPLDSELVDFIHKNAHIIKLEDGETTADMWKRMVKYGVEKCDLAEIKLVYAKSGEPVTGVEFEYTEYEGKMLLNICNYDWNTNEEINVYYNDQKVTNMKDLITDKVYETNVLVEPYTPILLEF